MVINLFGRLIERVLYETERIRKVLPTLIRFGISELEDWFRKVQEKRTTCDHEISRPPLKRTSGKKKKVSKIRKIQK